MKKRTEVMLIAGTYAISTILTWMIYTSKINNQDYEEDNSKPSSSFSSDFKKENYPEIISQENGYDKWLDTSQKIEDCFYEVDIKKCLSEYFGIPEQVIESDEVVTAISKINVDLKANKFYIYFDSSLNFFDIYENSIKLYTVVDDHLEPTLIIQTYPNGLSFTTGILGEESILEIDDMYDFLYDENTITGSNYEHHVLEQTGEDYGFRYQDKPFEAEEYHMCFANSINLFFSLTFKKIEDKYTMRVLLNSEIIATENNGIIEVTLDKDEYVRLTTELKEYGQIGDCQTFYSKNRASIYAHIATHLNNNEEALKVVEFMEGYLKKYYTRKREYTV